MQWTARVEAFSKLPPRVGLVLESVESDGPASSVYVCTLYCYINHVGTVIDLLATKYPNISIDVTSEILFDIK